MAAVSVPKMIPPEASPIHKSRVAQGALAQLVSKFEGLISTSGGRQTPVPFSRSLPLSHSSSNLFSNLKTMPPQDASSLGDYVRRNNSICYISDLSPGDSTSNSERRPTCIRIPSVTASEMENIPNTDLYLCSRHKSVAERRRAFESSDGASSAWTSTRASTDVGHPMKLTHSRSWQTIRTQSSFNRYLSEDNSSNSSSESTVTAEGHHAKDVNNHRKSIFQHSNQAFSSIAGVNNRMKTMASLSPRTLKKEMSPLSAISHSGWMKLDNKTGEFFPSLKSNNTSNHTLPLLSGKHKLKENTSSSPSQKSPTDLKMKANLGAPQSKIASLRQIFDRPRSVTSSPAISAKTKRRVATPVNLTSTPRQPRRLQKSATVQMLGSMDSLKIETKKCDIVSPMTNSKSETLSTPNASVGKKDSPLKEKIGLFESLSRKSHDSSPSSTKSKKVHPESTFIKNYKRTVSGVKKSLQMKGALRRLSASLRTSSEDSTDAHPVKAQDSIKPKDAWWVGRDQAVTKKGESSKISSRTMDVKRPTASAMAGGYLKKKDTAPKEGSNASQSPTRISTRWFLADQGSSIGREHGKRLNGKTYHKINSKSHIPLPTNNASGNALFIVKSDARYRPLSPSRTHPTSGIAGSRALFRRQISRSGGPFVANAYCKLEQPKPVRAGEMKRLVSLCKNKVTRRASGGANQ